MVDPSFLFHWLNNKTTNPNTKINTKIKNFLIKVKIMNNVMKQ